MLHTSEVSRFRELSRFVVLVYTKMGGVEVDEGILSPITASTAGDGVPPDSPTYLFLHHPEELLASLDRHCPKPVEHRHPFIPNLPTLEVSTTLIATFNQILKLGSRLIEAAEALQRESHRRGAKRTPNDGEGVEANLHRVAKHST